MEIKTVVKKAREFLSQYGSNAITLEEMLSILSKQGYTVIWFNNIINDEDVSIIISELKLDELADKSKGFTYVDKNHRLVFVHEDLNNNEKLMVLAHEEGHIWCQHFGHTPIIGLDVSEEHEANEFAHYILHPPIVVTFSGFVRKHIIVCVIVLAVIALGVTGGIGLSHMEKNRSYYGEFYITPSGSRYHETDCIFIKNKTDARRLTVEEFESGEFEPCQICLP